MVVLFIGERVIKANTVQGAIDAALAAGFTHAHVYAADVFTQADEKRRGWFEGLVTRSFSALHSGAEIAAPDALHDFAPYTEVQFVQREVITSSINEHGYILQGHKEVIDLKHGPAVLEDTCDFPELDLDAL